MNTIHKVGGVALVLGGLLNIARMGPIYLSDGITFGNFPPHDLEGTLMVAKTGGWIPSHVMAIASLPLILFGALVLLGVLTSRGHRALGYGALSGLAVGIMLYAIAAVADGLVLPFAAENFAERLAEGSEAAALHIEFIHLAATAYGGTMAAVFILTSGVLGMVHVRAFDQRIIGIVGVAIAGLGLAGYLSGILTLSVSKSFWTVGPLLFSSFAYIAVTGWVLSHRLPDAETK